MVSIKKDDDGKSAPVLHRYMSSVEVLQWVKATRGTDEDVDPERRREFAMKWWADSPDQAEAWGRALPKKG